MLGEVRIGMARRVFGRSAVTLSMLALLVSGAAVPRAQEAQKPAAAQPRIPDVNCLDQNGKKLRFNTDLVKGKVVVISFIYTSCTYLCARIGESTARLQKALGDRVGRDVYLISVSTDPVTDTPEKLKSWATRLKAKDGWTLVTGEKAEMDQLLRVLTGDATGNKTHSPVLLIGNEAKNVWTESYAFESLARLIEQIDRVSGAASERQ
jgi:protein SCO1/2